VTQMGYLSDREKLTFKLLIVLAHLQYLYSGRCFWIFKQYRRFIKRIHLWLV